MNSLLKRKIAERLLEAPEAGTDGYEDWQIKCNSPEVGVVYLNAPDPKDLPKSLVLKTVNQGNQTMRLLKELAIKPFACTANGGKEIKPITLYLKVGIGKLDMYILSPTQDMKELKDFLQQWSAGKSFSKAKTGVKVNGKETEVVLPNACSICALMVWQPASPHENIVRVLFPGNAPQNKILEGLDRMKHLDFLKYPDAVQTSSGKITAMKKKDVSAMKKTTDTGSGISNGAFNGKVSPTKEVNACTDGVHCNTPPPSPIGVCQDGIHCNTPPPDNVCTDGIHCNTPPPDNVCTDGIHCNTPPPDNVCKDGKHCGTPPPDNVCKDGRHCGTPPPDNVCEDGMHCGTPPPEDECNDETENNTQSADFFNTNLNLQPTKVCKELDDNAVDNNRCTDGLHCNTPPPDDECDENGVNGNGECLGMAGGHEDNVFGASSDSQLPESQQGLSSDVNSNPTGPAVKPIDTSRLHGTESPERLASGEISPSDLVEYGMEEESDGTSSGHGTVGNTPEQTNPPSEPSEQLFMAGVEDVSSEAPVEESADERLSDRASPEIQSEQPSSGVEMEDLSSPSEQPHPWEPTIELSSQETENSAPVADVLNSPEIHVTEPAEVVSEARDDDEFVGQQGALDASCEFDESSEEISQASEIEVKPTFPDDDAEDKNNLEFVDEQVVDTERMHSEDVIAEEPEPESALPEAEEASYQPDKDLTCAETLDSLEQSAAPESEQEMELEERLKMDDIPATATEADQQVMAENVAEVEAAVPSYFESQYLCESAPQAETFEDDTQASEPEKQELYTFLPEETLQEQEVIVKETDLDEAVVETDLDQIVAAGAEFETDVGDYHSHGEHELVHETNLDEIETGDIIKETNLDEAITVEQGIEHEIPSEADYFKAAESTEAESESAIQESAEGYSEEVVTFEKVVDTDVMTPDAEGIESSEIELRDTVDQLSDINQELRQEEEMGVEVNFGAPDEEEGVSDVHVKETVSQEIEQDISSSESDEHVQEPEQVVEIDDETKEDTQKEEELQDEGSAEDLDGTDLLQEVAKESDVQVDSVDLETEKEAEFLVEAATFGTLDVRGDDEPKQEICDLDQPAPEITQEVTRSDTSGDAAEQESEIEVESGFDSNIPDTPARDEEFVQEPFEKEAEHETDKLEEKDVGAPEQVLQEEAGEDLLKESAQELVETEAEHETDKLEEKDVAVPEQVLQEKQEKISSRNLLKSW